MTRPSQGKQIGAWCFYDFANSPFTTLVVTFVFSTYFANVMVLGDNGDPDVARGTSLFSLANTLSALAVAFASPYLGALADQGGLRKRLLITATAIGIVATAGLYFPVPGQVTLALSLFIIANISFELGMVFYNSFLPDIAPAEKVGKISGMGWGLGYVGGLLALVFALFLMVQPDQPIFGLDKSSDQHIRATNLLVALWFAVFSLPAFIWLKESPKLVEHVSFSGTFAQLRDTFQHLRRYREIMWFLLARMFYNDGLITIFFIGGIYAAGTFGFETDEVIIFGIVLNITAGLGAFVMGLLDDKLGGKLVIQISLVGLIAGSVIALLAPDRIWFWVAGIMVGIFAGPNQSASRSLMSRFVPEDKENEFFGFFAFSGKATAFMGPLLLAGITYLFDSQRMGVSSAVILLLVGFLLLFKVNEKAGIAAKESPK